MIKTTNETTIANLKKYQDKLHTFSAHSLASFSASAICSDVIFSLRRLLSFSTLHSFLPANKYHLTAST